MYVSRVSGPAAASRAAAEPRVISVHQTFYPNAKGDIADGPHMTMLGGGWAAAPKSVSVDGKTYAVQHVASRGRGGPMDQYRVFMQTLASGNHSAIIKLENGTSVPVTFRVESAY